MPNLVIFSGRVAFEPELQEGTGNNNKTYSRTRVRLLRDDFAGYDGQGNRQTKLVFVDFTAWGDQAKRIVEHARVGDEMTIEASISNYEFEDDAGKSHVGYNYQVEKYEYGAPGKIKRQELAERNAEREAEQNKIERQKPSRQRQKA